MITCQRFFQPKRQYRHCVTAWRFLSSGASTTNTPRQVYDALVASGQLDRDAHQSRVVDALHATWQQLYQPSDQRKDKSWWPTTWTADSTTPRGLYLYGTVGTGKTMLMDLFYTTVPNTRKQRVHFHAFMLDVHARLHALKRADPTGDAVATLADQMARRASLLCFDELQVVDIADAMILRQLLTALVARKVVLVATSNRHPDALYLNGIQRASFLPCIDLLKRHCRVVDLNAQVDYRKKLAGTATPVYLHPSTPANQVKFEKMRAAQTSEPWAPTTIKTVNARDVVIPAASGTAAATFTFHQLCVEPKSAADYIAICSAFPVLFIHSMYPLTLLHRNEARRWITFIDAAYEQKCAVICLADVSMLQLFDPNSGGTVFDELFEGDADGSDAPSEEAFAFHRSLSRLIQMQSDQWLRPRLTKALRE